MNVMICYFVMIETEQTVKALDALVEPDRFVPQRWSLSQSVVRWICTYVLTKVLLKLRIDCQQSEKRRILSRQFNIDKAKLRCHDNNIARH